MLRYIMRRRTKHTSGAVYESLFTVDNHIEAEQELRSGGLSEDTYMLVELVGVEIISD